MWKDCLEEIEKAKQQDWAVALEGDCVEPNLQHAVLLVAASDGAIGH